MMNYPNFYNPYFQQVPEQYRPVQQMSQQSNGLIWVQGESGAKSYLVAPNSTVLLMDSETDQFFIKSSDASGMPLPLRTFKYTEIGKNSAIPATSVAGGEYVTRAEFDAFIAKMEGKNEQSL